MLNREINDTYVADYNFEDTFQDEGDTNIVGARVLQLIAASWGKQKANEMPDSQIMWVVQCLFKRVMTDIKVSLKPLQVFDVTFLRWNIFNPFKHSSIV